MSNENKSICEFDFNLICEYFSNLEYAGNKSAENYISFERYEMGLYYQYKAFYGFVFYIGKKR